MGGSLVQESPCRERNCLDGLVPRRFPVDHADPQRRASYANPRTRATVALVRATLFERPITVTRERRTIGNWMYMADAFGYLR
jgi:hypothetical protein